MPAKIPTVTLNNGVQMPVLGFGVYQIPSEQTEQAVTDALAAGYRSLDTAAAYGNEEAVGRAIANSAIPRDKPFVTTKVWIQKPGEENAKRAFAASLEQLGLNIDIFDIELTYEQMTRIAALDTGASQFFDHHDPAIVGWLGNRRDD